MLQALTAEIATKKIEGFSARYAEHWNEWLSVSGGHDFGAGSTSLAIASQFKRILGSWQACRPMRLRGTTELRSTLDSISGSLTMLGTADLRSFRAPAQGLRDGIRGLWRIFEDGLCVGKAKVVGVSKAILLVTKGRIGPAFDSRVNRGWYVYDCESYLSTLTEIAGELALFEGQTANLEDVAAKAGKPAAVGRAVDMVFWSS